MDTLPSLSALRAFEAVLRTGSVVKAGTELNVTHAAISQQLRRLEADLGVQLLDRSGRKLQPTTDGIALGHALREGFERIKSGVEALQQKSKTQPLRITTTPAFATTWLMTRLGTFRTLHPDIEVMISATCDLVDLEEGHYDVAIRFGASAPRGVKSCPLLLTRLAVLGAPSLVGIEPVHDLRELCQYPWLIDSGQTEFMSFLTNEGLDPEAHRNRITMEGTLHHSAMLAGQGITMMGKELVRADIDAGRLTVLYDNINPREGSGYRALWLERNERPAMRKFIAWLAKQD